MNFLGMGPMELLLIIVLALIVFGPAKLPEIMAQVGKAINDFRRATSDLSGEFNRTIQAELQEGRSVLNETKSAVTDVHSTINSAITGTPAPTRIAAPGEMLTPNGASSEPYAETTNGAVPSQVSPPLAESVPWSWETSAPPSPPAPTSDSPGADPVSTDAPSEPLKADGRDSVEPTKPATPDPSAPKERTARDELLPPY
jgi:TatA/E family protein of Tat protein translocase